MGVITIDLKTIDLKDFSKIGLNYVRHYRDISTPDKTQKSKSKSNGVQDMSKSIQERMILF